LGIRLFELTSTRHRLIKHPTFLWRTWRLIIRHRPRVVIVQSPSIVLNILVVLLKPIHRFRLVVDAHNAGVYSCEPRTDSIKWLYPFLQKRAELTIVTNELLAGIVRLNGGIPQVLIDPLPMFERQVAAPVCENRVTFICTFAADEPFNEVFAAADLLSPDIVVNVTGKVEANRHLITSEPPANVNFTGFLPEQEFVSLLATSAVVIDLTTWDDCLVCGGYESMALGTPLILSDTPVNRQTFRRGALFCNNTSAGIAQAIDQALHDNVRLRDEARLGKLELESLFQDQLALLRLEA
jgi:glycosyltransferase involved in cell wall biosynthesis